MIQQTYGGEKRCNNLVIAPNRLIWQVDFFAFYFSQGKVSWLVLGIFKLILESCCAQNHATTFSTSTMRGPRRQASQLKVNFPIWTANRLMLDQSAVTDLKQKKNTVRLNKATRPCWTGIWTQAPRVILVTGSIMLIYRKHWPLSADKASSDLVQ